MKRSEALKEILDVLSNWEGSMLEMRTAKEILDRLENKCKMQPPIWFEKSIENLNGVPKEFLLPHPGWEKETRLKRRPMKEISESIRKNRNKKIEGR